MERDRLHRYADPSLETVSNDVTEPRAGRNPLIPDAPLLREADGNGVHAHAENAVAEAATSSGSALPGAIMRKFEGALGTDLSAVRVHTGTASETAAASVGARAYTVGQDIHFGRGQYDPGSERGEHLLAHEVAHTVQQSSGAAARKPMFKLEVSSPGDSHEVEADRAADAMVAGRAAQTTATSGVMRKLFRDFNDGWLDGAYPSDNVAKPLDWGATAASPQMPTGSWGGAPAYPEPAPKDPKRIIGRSTFLNDWIIAIISWNAVSQKCAAIQGQTSVGVLTDLGIPTSVPVAEGTGDGAKSFKGTDPDFEPIDNAKLSHADIEAIGAKKVEVIEAESLVSAARDTIKKGLNGYTKGANAVRKAVLNAQAKQLDGKVAEDEAAIKKLESDKALAVGTIEAGTSAVQGIQKVLVGAATGDLGMSMSGLESITGGLGKGAATATIRGFDNEINAIGNSITASKTAIADLATQVEGLNAADGFLDMDNALTDILAGGRDLTTAQAIKTQKYMELGNLMAQKSQEADPMGNPENAEKLRAAVQAVPAMEKIISDWGEAASSVVLPSYSEASGIGAAQAENYGEFASRIGILRGAPEFTKTQVNTWTLRLNHVNAMLKR